MRVLRDLLRSNREFAIGVAPAGARRRSWRRCRSSRPIRRTTATSCRPTCRRRWAYLARHDLARPGRVLAADLRDPQHAAVRHRRRAAQPLLVAADRPDRRLRRRHGRPRADVDQRHLHRHPAVPDPGAVLLRHARPHVVGPAGADDGLPRLGLRRAPDPLGGDEPAHPRIHRDRHLLRHEHAADPGRGASALRAADRLLDHHEQHQLVDRAGGDAVGAGLHRHQHADHRRDDLLGQPAHRAGRRHLVVDRLPGAAGGHDLHRPVPARGVDERIHRSAQPARAGPAR